MPFILTLLAGFSTLIGYFTIYLSRKNSIIYKSLGFASGVMICISILDLIPNSFKLFLSTYNMILSILFILISFNIGIIISKSISKINIDNKLYRVGILSMITIILHNIPEGIATYLTTSNDITLGITFTIALAAHNIPEGISIAIPIYHSTKSKFKAFLYTFISGISEFIGAIIASIFFKDNISNFSLAFIYSIIAGIMICLSYIELFKTSLSYNRVGETIIYFILGFVFMMLI